MKGFTLLETAVVLAIMSILTGLVLVGWPRARQQQALLLATEQVQTMIRTAQQKALNEDRSAECLSGWVGSSPEEQRLCSDVGVVINGNEIIIFADTQDDDKYTPKIGGDDPDFSIEKQTLPLGVIGDKVGQSFIFEATPPTIGLKTSHGDKLRLQSGEAAKTVTVKNYGQVE